MRELNAGIGTADRAYGAMRWSLERIVAQTDFFDAPTFHAHVGWSSQLEPTPEANENQGPS